MLSRETIQEILAKPSGLYGSKTFDENSPFAVVKRQVGVGFILGRFVGPREYQEDTYDEDGKLVDVSTYIE